MSSQLFNSKPIHISEVPFVKSSLETFFNMIGLKNDDWRIVGSLGKKEFSGDVDIAVKFDNKKEFEEWRLLFTDLNLDFKPIKGFNCISFGFPLQIEPLLELQIIQVDLFLTHDLNWTEYMLYSPDINAGESKFKGVYRNLLLMAYSIVVNRSEIDEWTWEQDQIEIFTGWYRVKKTFKSESGKILKTARIIEKYLLTDDIYFIFSSLGLNKCNTLEDLICQVRGHEKINDIKNKFEDYCNNLKLEIPKWD